MLLKYFLASTSVDALDLYVEFVYIRVKMVELCKPFNCKFLDGLLATLFTCSLVGASVLICTVYLDQEMNHGHCIVLNLNTTATKIDVPEQFNKVLCESVKIVAITQIATPLILIFFSWILGFNSYLLWWIFESIVICLQTVIALVVGVLFTTTLLIFCGQLFWATKENSCLYGAMKYDQMYFPVHGQFSDKTQLAFDHVVAVVAASWFVFFSYLFAALVILVRACTRFYHEKEQKMHKLQMAVLFQNVNNARRQQQQYQYLHDHEQEDVPEDTPLIQL